MALEPCLLPGHPLWEVFHESSKWQSDHFAEVARRARALASAPVTVNRRPIGESGPQFQFPEVASGLVVPLGEALKRRRSSRALAGRPLGWDQIGTLLWAAGGALPGVLPTGHRRRTFPSAGACYPVEIYFCLPVPPDGAAAGPYCYLPEQGGYAALPCEHPLEELLAASAYPDLVAPAGLLVFVVGVPARVTTRYGARGYRFVLIESGHIGQNLYLAAAAMDLAVVALGGWDDALVDRWLGLDGIRASSLYAIAVGHQARDHVRD
jgi:SagB-type dehydrogenase family enzyme